MSENQNENVNRKNNKRNYEKNSSKTPKFSSEQVKKAWQVVQVLERLEGEKPYHTVKEAVNEKEPRYFKAYNELNSLRGKGKLKKMEMMYADKIMSQNEANWPEMSSPDKLKAIQIALLDDPDGADWISKLGSIVAYLSSPELSALYETVKLGVPLVKQGIESLRGRHSNKVSEKTKIEAIRGGLFGGEKTTTVSGASKYIKTQDMNTVDNEFVAAFICPETFEPKVAPLNLGSKMCPSKSSTQYTMKTNPSGACVGYICCDSISTSGANGYFFKYEDSNVDVNAGNSTTNVPTTVEGPYYQNVNVDLLMTGIICTSCVIEIQFLAGFQNSQGQAILEYYSKIEVVDFGTGSLTTVRPGVPSDLQNQATVLVVEAIRDGSTMRLTTTWTDTGNSTLTKTQSRQNTDLLKLTIIGGAPNVDTVKFKVTNHANFVPGATLSKVCNPQNPTPAPGTIPFCSAMMMTYPEIYTFTAKHAMELATILKQGPSDYSSLMGVVDDYMKGDKVKSYFHKKKMNTQKNLGLVTDMLQGYDGDGGDSDHNNDSMDRIENVDF